MKVERKIPLRFAPLTASQRRRLISQGKDPANYALHPETRNVVKMIRPSRPIADLEEEMHRVVRGEIPVPPAPKDDE